MRPETLRKIEMNKKKAAAFNAQHINHEIELDTESSVDENKTFYFDTGVRYLNYPTLFGDTVVINGTKQIPFVCANMPDKVEFMFACDYDNLQESKIENVIVRPIIGKSGLCSKFAYFKVIK